MILVTGASGTVGREVVRELAAAGARFRAGYRSRRPDAPPGVDTVAVDFDRPETLPPAFEGVETLFLLSNAVLPEGNAVAAARQAGVRRIVKLSVWAAPEEGFVFARLHRAVEKEIEASGLAWTFLRPGSFMQNLVNYGGDALRREGAIYTSAPEARISHVDARDIGAMAARVLSQGGHEGRAYELSGPAALTYHEVAAILSQVLRREFKCVPITDEDYKKGAIGAGMPAEFAEALVDLERYFRQGGQSRVSPVVKEMLGRDPIPFERFAQDYADRLR